MTQVFSRGPRGMKLSFTGRTNFGDGRSGAQLWAHWCEMPVRHPSGDIKQQFDTCAWSLREKSSWTDLLEHQCKDIVYNYITGWIH